MSAAGSLCVMEGDASSDAVAEIFRMYYPFVRRMLHHWGVSPSSLDDAAQDVFVVVMRRVDALEGAAQTRSWLVGITRRVARNHRRSSIRARLRAAIIAGFGASEPDPEPAAAFAGTDLAAYLLGKLPEAQRVAVVLTDLEGWSAPEIADALGVAVNTIYSRVREGRKGLRAAYARVQQRETGGTRG